MSAAPLGTTKPRSTLVRPRDVEIAVEGTLIDHDRMEATLELAAH